MVCMSWRGFRRALRAPTWWRLLSLSPFELDLEQFRPVLARHEEPIARRVVRNAVQHVGATAIGRREKPGEIDPAGHLAGCGIDAADAVSLPDVRQQGVAHDFELV